MRRWLFPWRLNALIALLNLVSFAVNWSKGRLALAALCLFIAVGYAVLARFCATALSSPTRRPDPQETP